MVTTVRTLQRAVPGRQRSVYQFSLNCRCLADGLVRGMSVLSDRLQTIYSAQQNIMNAAIQTEAPYPGAFTGYYLQTRFFCLPTPLLPPAPHTTTYRTPSPA